MIKKYTEEQLNEIVAKSTSMSDVMRNMGRRTVGGNRSYWTKVIRDLKIDTSHFTRVSGHGGCHKELSFYLCRGSRISTSGLKKKLFFEGTKEKRCEKCGLTEWLGKPIGLDLHHLDDDHTNNELCNLIILCSNCHSFVHGYGYKEQRRSESKKYLCPECGGKISRGSPRCKSCDIIHRRSRVPLKRPPKEVLEESLNRLHNLRAVGREFSVSDNSIRKWIEYYEIQYEFQLSKRIDDGNSPKST